MHTTLGFNKSPGTSKSVTEITKHVFIPPYELSLFFVFEVLLEMLEKIFMLVPHSINNSSLEGSPGKEYSDIGWTLHFHRPPVNSTFTKQNYWEFFVRKLCNN
ncbi:hypothetical protein WA026_005028 [Henosepilachna vigintioctopunctata]|uniref:Uncharacterized protein n=1 Tax=Henosepilachna vigintioctopunctata TaxID=420089 RepID=A0AAW1UVV1_9CUCU